jgi:hypothetical protein
MPSVGDRVRVPGQGVGTVVDTNVDHLGHGRVLVAYDRWRSNDARSPKWVMLAHCEPER